MKKIITPSANNCEQRRKPPDFRRREHHIKLCDLRSPALASRPAITQKPIYITGNQDLIANKHDSVGKGDDIERMDGRVYAIRVSDSSYSTRRSLKVGDSVYRARLLTIYPIRSFTKPAAV